MFFYEIHEGDEKVGTAVLLGHERHIEPEEFLDLVKHARALVIDSFDEETLSEAIANELQRGGGFLHVTDDRLVASVTVGEKATDTLLVMDDDTSRAIFLSRDGDGNGNAASQP